MREIKFRGQREDTKEWIYGYLHVIDTYGNGYTGRAIQQQFGTSRPYSVRVISETVGQYTGLKDKNGKEIYEGDIYHQGDKNILYIVVWNDNGFQGKQARASSYAGLGYWQDRIEIIGNEYDNPELLQEVSHERNN